MAEKKTKESKKVERKKYMNTFWLIAAVVSFFLLVGTAFGHVDEIRLKKWGNRIEAEYIDNGTYVYAEYRDEHNVVHTYNLNRHSPIHNGDKITLYYATVIDDAVPENVALSYFLYYIIYGGVFALSMYHVKKAERLENK